MKPFSETHPSLKDLITSYPSIHTQKKFWVPAESVQRFTLDKAVVRAAIERREKEITEGKMDDWDKGYNTALYNLKKELGLDQDGMKLYIFGQGQDGKTFGDGTYTIMTEEGEPLASHWSSHLGFAKGDLEASRPERQKEWKARFGEYQVVVLGDDDMTIDILVARNKIWYASQKETKSDGAA